MNFKNQAARLENFLDSELKSVSPVLRVNDQTLVYKNFKIKQNKQEWDLVINNDVIGSFKLRAGAIMAAKYFEKKDLKRFNEVKTLDFQYWQHSVDEEIFRYKINTTKDFDKKDIFQARWMQSRDRAKIYKQKITSLFRSSFDK